MHPRHRTLATFALVSAVLALLYAPFHAAAYLATEHGEEGLEMPTTRAWAVPFRAAFEPLLTFADADAVYFAWGKLGSLLFLGLAAGLLPLRAAHAGATTRALRWGFPTAIVGTVLLGVGGIVVFWVLGADVPAVDYVFVGTMLPGTLAMIVGYTMVGVGMARARVAPPALGWLFAAGALLQIPLQVLLGHNPIGMSVLFVAWVWAGVWMLRRAS